MATINSKFEHRAWEVVSYFSLGGEEMINRSGKSTKFVFGKKSEEFSNFIFGMVVYALENQSAMETLFNDCAADLIEELRAFANCGDEGLFNKQAVCSDPRWDSLRKTARICLFRKSLDYIDPKRQFVIDELIETGGYG